MSRLEVALIQLRSPADPWAAFEQAQPLIRQAAAGGARFILTPEGTNFLQRDRGKLAPLLRSQDDDVCVRALAGLAAALKVWLLVGSALVAARGGGAANRSILFDSEGNVAATYDKIHMFDVDLPTGEHIRESRAYAPGDAAVAADAPWGRLGLTICYDLRFPQLYRSLAKAGASLLTVPAAFTRPTGQAHWEILLRARAIETGAFVLAPAQGGRHQDGRETWGRSMVVGPWGEVLAQADHDEPCVVSAALDLEAVARARAAIPALVNERPFRAPFGTA